MSVCRLVALLRVNLFTHRDLHSWIDEPYGLPPDPDETAQIAMAFG